MSRDVVNMYVPDEVSAPGETLREILAERGLSQADLSTRMGRPQKTISEIINGKAAITPETALQLELVLGVPAAFWTAREQHYRDYIARQAQRDQLARFQTWAKRFPVTAMVNAGLLPQTASKDLPRAVLEFFGVAAPEQWEEVQGAYQVAFRKSVAFDADRHALAVWLRAGQIRAERLACEPFDRGRFLNVLTLVRSLTAEPPEAFQPRMTELCAGAGVAVAFVPELPKSRASGVTRWISSDRALIQLSLRYRTDDHLWFTFFHEAAHILLHGKRLIFLETSGHRGEEEEEANQWAADFLIPPADFGQLVEMGVYSKAGLIEFASRIGIAPGIVVGRLQHEGLLPRTHCNDLKRRFEWVIRPGQG